MSISEFTELLKENKIQYNGEISPEKTIAELGFDSFDITMLTYEIESAAGRELKFSATDTIGDILAKVNNG